MSDGCYRSDWDTRPEPPLIDRLNAALERAYAAEAERDRLREDKARLDWLEANPNWPIKADDGWHTENAVRDTLRGAVDAERKDQS